MHLVRDSRKFRAVDAYAMMLSRPLLRRAALSSGSTFRRGLSTVGKPIECLAAVAWEPKAKYWEDALSVEPVIVHPPMAGEVCIYTYRNIYIKTCIHPTGLDFLCLPVLSSGWKLLGLGLVCLGEIMHTKNSTRVVL